MSPFIVPTIRSSFMTCALLLSCMETTFSAVTPTGLDEESRKAGDKATADLKARAEQGDPEAQYRWGAYCIYEQEKNADGLHWLLLAVKQGNLDAEAMAGFCYANGVGTKVDSTESIRLLLHAASKGNANALQTIGMYSISGLGPLPKDLKQAEQYLLQARAKGAGGQIDYQLKTVQDMLKKQDSAPPDVKPSP